MRGDQDFASITSDQLVIDRLGEPRFDSPLKFDSESHAANEHFVTDDDQVLVSIDRIRTTESGAPLGYEEAGPREGIFFNPSDTTAAFVTCGGR